jgi:hypothetical protein
VKNRPCGNPFEEIRGKKVVHSKNAKNQESEDLSGRTSLSLSGRKRKKDQIDGGFWLSSDAFRMLVSQDG